MRFDDSLETVLSADMSTPFGAQSAWRQLVDLIGRRRIPADRSVIARLKAIRADVPPPVRAASARALAAANPPAALVRLFADDASSIAAPVLRVAVLRADEWIDMLPDMSPSTRSVLRHRRDLPDAVTRALESFGSVDFRLSSTMTSDAPVELSENFSALVAQQVEGSLPEEVPVPQSSQAPLDIASAESLADAHPDAASPSNLDFIDWTEVVGEAVEPLAGVGSIGVGSIGVRPADDIATETATLAAQPGATVALNDATPNDATLPEIAPEIPADADVATQSIQPEARFVSLSSVALGLPVVAEALRLKASAQDAGIEADSADALVGGVTESAPSLMPVTADRASAAAHDFAPVADGSIDGTFQIAELVARIDAFQRQRDEQSMPHIAGQELQPELFDLEPYQAQAFRFETDLAGVVRWIEGAARAPLIGMSLDLSSSPNGACVDGVAAGAFRRRAGFANARLVVDGTSDAAGQWRITGIPVFDRESGRFTGYRGSARRPRAEERAEPVRVARSPASEALRQLVHELRTPTNAIAGFAEMIETQLLGPVPQAYRDQAGTIRNQAAGLLTAIDDIDLAARIESHALDLRPGQVPVGPLLDRIAADLAPLLAIRRAHLSIRPGAPDLAIAGDDRAVERLVARLMATLASSAGADETITVSFEQTSDGEIACLFDRPAALAAYGTEAILTIDAEVEAEAEGAPLLGTGFALRLARNLAVELGGTLAIADKSLTLHLPAAVIVPVEQAFSN